MAKSNIFKVLEKITRGSFGDVANEMCSHCMEEHEISSSKPSKCPTPKCTNKLLLPCSTCIFISDYNFCDWTEKRGCVRFPK